MQCCVEFNGTLHSAVGNCTPDRKSIDPWTMKLLANIFLFSKEQLISCKSLYAILASTVAGYLAKDCKSVCYFFFLRIYIIRVTFLKKVPVLPVSVHTFAKLKFKVRTTSLQLQPAKMSSVETGGYH